MTATDMRPANNIPTYRPTPEQVESHLAKLRGPRSRKPEVPDREPAAVA